MTKETNKKSILSKIDSRVKIVLLFHFAIIAAISNSFQTLFLALALSFFLVAISPVKWKTLLGRLLIVNSFLFLMWLIIPLTHPGDTVIRIFGLSAQKEGFLLVFIITLKANSIFIAASALFGASSVFDIAHGLDHLKVPTKLVQLLFFTWRYAALLSMEIARQRNAMKVRCFQAKMNTHTYRSYAYLLGMLLVRSLDRAQRVYQAMICRGFSGTFPAYNHPKFKLVDIFASFLSAGIVIGMGLVEWRIWKTL